MTLNKTKNWTPCILPDNELYGEIVALLQKTNQYFIQKHEGLTDKERLNAIKMGLSPMTGTSGEILYLYYAGKFNSSDRLFEIADIELGKLFDLMGNNVGPTLSRGLSGFLWMLFHLENKGFIETLDDDLVRHTKKYLYPDAKSYLKNGIYDYLKGGLGFCVPMIESQDREEDYTSILSEFVDLLDKSAVKGKEPDTVYWNYLLNEVIINDNPISFGLSHGLSGIIVILSAIAAKGIAADKCNRLIRQSLNYILATKNSQKKGPIYPSFTLETLPPPEKHRLGWCYGDLSTAVALFNGYKTLGDRIYLDEVKTILDHGITNRLTHYDPLVNSDFCHGLSGVIQIYNRFGNSLDPDRYQKFIEKLVRELFTRVRFEGDTVKLYTVDNPETNWQTDTSLIYGLSGLALTLQALISDESPDWDAIFLLGLGQGFDKGA